MSEGSKTAQAGTSATVPTVTITVHWGGHRLSPVQYNTLDVPDISATISGIPADKLGAAVQKLYAQLEAEGRVLFEKKIEEHKAFIKQGTARVGSHAR